jgi:tetratricopeptide (TPR) repeat protein
VALAAQGRIDEPVRHYTKAVRLNPRVDTSAALHEVLAMNYADAGRFRDAVAEAQRALELARAAGNQALARQIERQVALYKRNRPYPRQH